MEKVYLLPIKGSEGRKQIIFSSKDLAELYKAKHNIELDVVQINMNATKFLNVDSDSITKKVIITDDYGNEYTSDIFETAKLTKVLKQEIKAVENLIDEQEDEIITEDYEIDN